MKISLDGMILQSPLDAINWDTPRLISRDGDYAPVRGQFHSCRLSFGKLAVPSLNDWQAAYDTLPHTIILPHPRNNGEMTSYTCYIDSISTRYDISDQGDDCAVIAGFDIALSGIIIT